MTLSVTIKAALQTRRDMESKAMILLTMMLGANPAKTPRKKASEKDDGILPNTAGHVELLIILAGTVNLKKKGTVMTLHLRIG